MIAIAFGGQRHERLEIAVHGYERPALSGDYHDDNWLVVQISIAAGAFRGAFQGMFQTTELAALRSGLKELQRTLTGEVRFETLEAQLGLRFVGNGLGSIRLTGQAYDQPGIGNCLNFSLDLDQTQIGAAIEQLDAVLTTFPVRDV